MRRRYSPAMRTLLLSSMMLLSCSAAFSQQLSELTLPPGGNGRSQRAEVSQWIGPVKVTIAYHSPRVKTRATDRAGHIWGEMIPYGLFDEGFGPSTAAPWRAGANESTTITLSHDVKIEQRDIKAGTYALFLQLEKSGPWTWILSRHAGWGAYQYNPKDDVLRVPVNPVTAPYTEYLTYGFDDRRPDAATAFLQWENQRIPFEIEVPNVAAIYVDTMRQELEGWPGFNYQNWQTAAQFCADHKINLDEALVWADRAISEPFRNAAMGREDFSTLHTKADVLRALQRDADADAVMARAIALPATSAFELYGYGSQLLAAGSRDKALDVFMRNLRQHPDEPYWTHLGLARAYTAANDKAHAIAEWEIALKNVPPSQRANVPQFQRALEQLRVRP
jgi:hypothetical protein